MTHVTTKDGVQLYVKDWGHGRPVVMMHGWPLSADTFDDLALTLVEGGFRAISYDRRGFGRSAQPWSGYDYDTLADDLSAVLDATGATDATLLGFSMGGGEVARYLSRHGAAGIRQAILVASVVPSMLQTDDNPGGVPLRVLEEIGTSIRADRADYWPTFFKQFYGVGMLTSPVSDEVIKWSCRLAMQAGLRSVLACAEAFSMTDFGPDLAAFTVPTLVVHGTNDKTVPIDTSARRAVEGIPGAILREYVDAPHGLLASHKDTLAADVLAFVRGEALPEPITADVPAQLFPGVDPRTA